MIAALPRLHAVTDDRVVAAGSLASRAALLAAAAGPELAVHLRSSKLPGGPFLAVAGELADALRPYGAALAINGRADVARLARARAVVSGRGGLGVADVRRVAPQALVGRSVHDEAEIEAAKREQPDFLVAGSVYPTASHPERAPAGLTLVGRAAKSGKPVIAIGGITPERSGEVAGAGAWGVAAIRALWDAPDPGAAASAFLAALPPLELASVIVNGEARRARRGITLAELLGELSLDPAAVVVEHNRRIVRRGDLASTLVAEGDVIELVHFVGGG